MIPNHVADLQVFNGDAAESGSELAGQLVKEVTPLVADFVVSTSQLEFSFASVSASLLLPTQPSVKQLQPFLTFDEEARITYDFAIGKDGEVLNANINPHLLSGRMLNPNVRHFAGEDGEPLPSPVSLDGEGFDFALRDAMQDDWDVANLGSVKLPITDKLESALRVSNAINPTLESGKAFFLTGRVFDSAKEALKRSTQSVRNISLNLRIYFGMFINKIFIIIKFLQSLFIFLVSFNGHIEKFIIDYLTGFERIYKSNFLFTRRINTITIHPEFHKVVS